MLDRQERPSRPTDCPVLLDDRVWTLIERAWSHHPRDRLTATGLVEEITSWIPPVEEMNRTPSLPGVVDPPDIVTERRHADSRTRHEEIMSMTGTSLSFNSLNSPSGDPDWFDTSQGSSLPPPFDILQLLMSWVDVWSMDTLNAALESTKPSSSIDAVALTIWTMQACRRFHDRKTTSDVSMLYVSPYLAGVINHSIFLGHSEKASMILQYLWHGIGQPSDATPRSVLVLCQDWSDPSKWVVLRCVRYLIRKPIHQAKRNVATSFLVYRGEAISYQPTDTITVRHSSIYHPHN